MRVPTLLPLILTLAAAAPPSVEVRLSSFDFAPGTVRLKAGEPVVLHLVNTGGGAHDFAAPQFFAAARGVSGPVRGGTVEVGGTRSVDVRLTPARGTYKLRCSHTLHSTLGMTGRIIVE